MDERDLGLMSVAATGAALGYTVQHIRLLLREGRLRGRKVGKVWLVDSDAVEEQLQQRNTPVLFLLSKRGRPRKGARYSTKRG